MNKGIVGITPLLAGVERPKIQFSDTQPSPNTTTSLFYVDLGGPTLIVEETGWYAVDFGCAYARTNGGTGSPCMAVAINGRIAGFDPNDKTPVGTLDTDGSIFLSTIAASNGSAMATERIMFLKKGDNVRCKYRTTANTALFSRNVWLKLTRIN